MASPRGTDLAVSMREIRPEWPLRGVTGVREGRVGSYDHAVGQEPRATVKPQRYDDCPCAVCLNSTTKSA